MAIFLHFLTFHDLFFRSKDMCIFSPLKKVKPFERWLGWWAALCCLIELPLYELQATMVTYNTPLGFVALFGTVYRTNCDTMFELRGAPEKLKDPENLAGWSGFHCKVQNEACILGNAKGSGILLATPHATIV